MGLILVLSIQQIRLASSEIKLESSLLRALFKPMEKHGESYQKTCQKVVNRQKLENSVFSLITHGEITTQNLARISI